MNDLQSCVQHGVHGTLLVWEQMLCDNFQCDRHVCERCCVTKLCHQFCVKDSQCVTKGVCDRGYMKRSMRGTVTFVRQKLCATDSV